MKLNRKIAALLLCLMLLPMLFSCSESKNTDQPKTDAGTSQSSAAQGGEQDENDPDPYALEKILPAANYDGAAFTILTLASASAHDTMPRFDHEEITGEPVNDAIYNQVDSVEVAYNAKISYNPSNNVPNDVNQAAASGDDTYKVVIYSNQGLAELVTRNVFLDLNLIDQIDFSRPWWNEAYKKNLTVAGKTYCGFGDLFFEAGINNVHLMYVNKDMCAEYGLESPYQTVYEGKWTLDYIINMVKGVQTDLNGDGTYDEVDRWGLVQSPIQSSIMFYTSGFHIMSFDEEGYPYLDMYSEEFVNFYEKLYQLDYKTPEIWTNTQAQEDPNFQMFVEGKVLLSSHFLTVTSTLREVEFEVGILPYPKYSEDAPYINWPTGGNFLMAIPSVLNPADYDFVGTITEALAAQGHRFVRPALYEVTLQGKLARDKESQDMLDLIFDTMSVDFGWIHNGSGGLGWFVSSCLDSKLPSIASVYSRMEKRADKYYAGVVDFYRSINE